MKSPPVSAVRLLRTALLAAAALLSVSPPAAASFLSGEALDTAADVIAIVVLVVVPVVVIVVFWLVHILPEKIAEKRKHPQAEAVKVICLLSLVFGGMLWPIAWIIAYTKPVLYRLAYGRDTHEHGEAGQAPGAATRRAEPTVPAAPGGELEELRQLRERLAQIEARLADTGKGTA